jgi:aromatic ring-opening dioxygenase LigB subunit
MALSVLGIIAPHPPIMVAEVGRAEADVTEHSVRALELAAGLLREYSPDTVVVMSPHATGAYDAFGVEDAARVAGDLGQFGAPQVRIETQGDPGLAAAVLDAAATAGIPAMPRSGFAPGASLDHGVLVPMSFLDRAGAFPILVLSFSFLPLPVHREFGALVAQAARSIGRKVAFVASGDCSHRLFPGAPAGYSPRGRDYDRFLIDTIGRGDWDALTAVDPGFVEDAGECGTRSAISRRSPRTPRASPGCPRSRG